MSSFKERLISSFKVLLSTVLGAILILGGSDYAQAQGQMPYPILLEPNTAYKVERTSVVPSSKCYGETAQVKFTFQNPQFKNGVFEETYPIQEGWTLFFNTPETDKARIAQNLYFQDLTGCNLVPEKASLELLSGFKTKEEASLSGSEGHFVVAKDYYAFSQETGEYKLLGSLTAIGGTEFPALKGAAIGQLIIQPDSIRAPHWHLKYNETGYCYQGVGQVGIIVPGNTLPQERGNERFFSEPRVEEFFVKPGEIFHFPEASQHYLRNVGNEPFSCTLFFAEGQALSEDKLLTITLQNIVGGTPLGVLGPILVTEKDSNIVGMPPVYYTAKRVSESPAQTYTSVNQGPDVVKVVETCSGENPDYNNPGCPSLNDSTANKSRSRFSIYSTLKP
ncbi:MAG: cupin domain-containing protein [Calothrix sp. MO_192.B10]|nr:cupin domain-containing protein [Calothrix sp. MO_192.B10]